MSIKHLYEDERPTLLLDFANSKTLDPRITFERQSVGTYVDEQGIIRTAADNEARFDHDPVTGECLGLLIEEERTNSWTYSEQPSQSPWTQTNITVTENNVTSPDGNLTGALLSSSSSGSSYVYQTHNEDIPTFTIYAKAGTTNNLWVRLQSNVVSRNVAYNFNLSDGTFSVATGNTGNLTGWTERKSITNAGNGWYRIEMGFSSSTSSVTTDYQISPSTDGNAGASGETVYIWGAQLEKDKTFPTSYIPTSGSSTYQRLADEASITGTNFSSWYNQSEGTFRGSFYINNPTNTVYSAPSANYIFSVTDQSSNTTSLHVAAQLQSGSANVGTYMRNNNVAQLQSDSAVNGIINNQIYNFAVSYELNSGGFATQGDGINVSTVPSTLPAFDEMYLGMIPNAYNSNAKMVNGVISHIAYYNTRLSNTALEALTL